MAGGKLTPRQKMINMMYLVLTALLAMNVSSEVLDAFKVVEQGIENSNTVLKEKVQTVDEAFQKKLGEDPEAPALYEMTEQVSSITGDLYAYIDEVKAKIYEASGQDEVTGELKKKDDIDSPTRLLADPGTDAFMGEELQNKINEARTEIEAIIDGVPGLLDTQKDALKSSLTLSANDYPEEKAPKDKWYYKNFFQVPSAGVLTILTKIQNDVVGAEATVNESILKTIGALDFKFDKLRATVQAEKAYLPGGAEYEANIFLTASSSGIVAETYVGKLDMGKFEKDSIGDYIPFNHETETPFTSEPTKVENGKFKRTASIGQNTYEGAIKIANPKGGFDWYPFSSSFEGAAKGGFSISPTKMNVLYIGLDNPVSITIGDAKPGSESASIGQGSISKSGSGWIARVTTVGTTKITASGVNVSTGERTAANSMEFRVMRVPDPVPTLGGVLKGGRIQAGTLKAQSGLVALLENFPFDAKFSVVSYDFILSTKGEILPARDNSGPILGTQVKNLIGRAQPKDYAIFDNIKVKGPDGTTRKLPSLTFEII